MDYDVCHRQSKDTPYHPQMNGLAEQINQAIVHILYKTIENHQLDWDSNLNTALWASCTIFKVITK